MQFISRVVGGWNVRMMVGGKRQGKFFADSKYGSKTKALAAAKAYRDPIAADRPSRLSLAVPRPLRVKRGRTECFQIRLPQPKGGSTTTEFSITRHGVRKAKQMAIDAFQAAKLAALE